MFGATEVVAVELIDKIIPALLLLLNQMRNRGLIIEGAADDLYRSLTEDVERDNFYRDILRSHVSVMQVLVAGHASSNIATLAEMFGATEVVAVELIDKIIPIASHDVASRKLQDKIKVVSTRDFVQGSFPADIVLYMFVHCTCT